MIFESFILSVDKGLSDKPVQTLATIGSLIVAIIGIYRFAIKRPSLILEMHPFPKNISHIPIREQANLVPVFYLKNTGRRYAEDIYLEIEMESWNFDCSDVNADPNGEPLSKSRQTKQAPSGKKTKQKSPTLQPSHFPPQGMGPLSPAPPNAYYSEKEEETDYPISELSVASEDTDHFIGEPGEIRKITFGDIIYPNSEFKIYFGGATLEPMHKYELNYTIACRSVGRKSGKYIIHVLSDDITIYHQHRSFFYSIKQKKELIKQKIMKYFERI